MAILVYDNLLVRTISARASETLPHTYGETIEAGQPVYLKSSDGKVYLLDCNVTVAEADFFGYAIQNGNVDQKGLVQTGGIIYLGVNALAGMLYLGSATVGQTEEATTALASGLITTIIGYGDENFNIVINPVVTGKTVL